MFVYPSSYGHSRQLVTFDNTILDTKTQTLDVNVSNVRVYLQDHRGDRRGCYVYQLDRHMSDGASGILSGLSPVTSRKIL